MFIVYPTKMKAMKSMHKEFATEDEANAFISSRKNPGNFTLQKPINEHTTTQTEKAIKGTEKATKASRAKKNPDKMSVKEALKKIDFSNAQEITRENVKNFYKKEGYIQVVKASDNTVLHVGRTKNMGKVFSNYVNCARYKQSYHFNLNDGQDKLLFKEETITI